MIVVFDTNIWKSSLFLQSPAAAATRHFLVTRGARVGMPEVVRREVTRHLSKDVGDLIAATRENHQRLLRLFGSMRELVLPTQAEQEALVERLFASFGVGMIDMPLTIESASDSFNRTIDKIPPSATNQQFKDGVLWADCLKFAECDEVILVANDNAFYDQPKSNEMHPLLRQEATKCKHRVRLMRDITALLAEIRVKVDLDPADLENAVLGDGRAVSTYLDECGFEFGQRTKVDRRLFATENPALLFLDFTLQYSCPDATSKGRQPGTLTISGTGLYEPGSKRFSAIARSGDRFQFVDESGADNDLRSTNISAHINLGHAIVRNSTRFPLDH